MKRILKPNGLLLISVPIYPRNNPTTFENSEIEKKDYLNVHGHDDHCRSCGFDYFERFEQMGFKTETLIVNNLDEKTIKKFGLSKNHRSWLFKN